MKKTPKLLLSIAGCILLATTVLRAEEPAAGKPDRPDRGERRERGPGGGMMERAVKELGLSADQQARWKAIGEQERTALEALRADTTVAKEDKRAKAMEINKGFGDQRRAVLNAEQQAKFDEMRAKMRERGERGPKKDKVN